MAGLFSKAASKFGGVFGFGSSQINGSSGAEATDSQLRSSQSYLNTKAKSPKRRKSLEDIVGSGKKKHKKQRQSIDYEQEFEGFGDEDNHENTHDEASSSILDVNGNNGEEQVENSTTKPKDFTKKHAGKKQSTPEKSSTMKDGIDGGSASKSLPDTNGVAITNADVVDPQMSRRQRKKLRRSLEAQQINKKEPQVVVEQSVSQAQDLAATPTSLIFNGVSVENLSKSQRKKLNKRRLSSSSAIDEPELQTQNGEHDSKVASSPAPVAESKKKSKKRRRSSLVSEVSITATPAVDQAEEVNGDYAERAELLKDEGRQQDLPASDPTETPKQKRKHKKKRISEILQAEELSENGAGPSREHEAHPRKSKKPKQKKARRDSNGGASVDLHTQLNGLAEPETSYHTDVSLDDRMGGLQELEQGNETPIHEQVNGTPSNYRSPGPEQDANFIESQSKEKKSKKSRKKAAASESIDQSVTDTRSESPLIESEIPKPSEPKSKKPKSREASSPFGTNSNATPKVASSKLKKSKNQYRENAFKEAFADEEDDLADYLRDNPLPQESIQSASSPSWRAINRDHIKGTPSQNIGIYDDNGSRVTSLKKSQKKQLPREDKTSEKDTDSPEVLDVETPAAEDVAEQVSIKAPGASSKRKRNVRNDTEANQVENTPAEKLDEQVPTKTPRASSKRKRNAGNDQEADEVAKHESTAAEEEEEQAVAKIPATGSKRKRNAKTDDVDVNPEALRLPTKKRRTRKSASQPVEEREANPEALRLPEKKKSRKSAATSKKPAKSSAAASTSSSGSKLKGPFTNDEIETLKHVLENFGGMYDLTENAVRGILQKNARNNEKTGELLKELSESLPNRVPEAIAKVARRKFHNYPRYGKWTAEEDEDLRNAVERHGKSWVNVAAELDRHPEDVRDRWRNVVVCGSNLEFGPWTKVEEDEMMNYVETRLANLRKMWSSKVYDEKLKTGTTEYDMIDWDLISNDLGRKRSRLQCQGKYKQIMDRKAPAASSTLTDPETGSWRTQKGKAEVTYMKPGDKLMLLRAIQRDDYGREDKIKFSKLGDEAFRNNFSHKSKKLALKYMRRNIPGGKQMTLQEVVATTIENIEAEFPDRLEQRYDPEVHGAVYPTRPRRKNSTSRSKVTASDDESSADPSSDEDEEDPELKRTPKMRDRMKRSGETDEESSDVQRPRRTRSNARTALVEDDDNNEDDDDDGEVQRPRRTRLKNRTALVEEKDDDEMEVDRDDDINMPDAKAEEDSQSGSEFQSPPREEELDQVEEHPDEIEEEPEVEEEPDEVEEEPDEVEEEPDEVEEEPEIEESDKGSNGPSYRSYRQTSEQYDNHEDLEEQQNYAESIDLDASREIVYDDHEDGESLNNKDDNDEAEKQGNIEDDSTQRERRSSSTSSRGRDFRLGRRGSNLGDGDLEISSDDSMEDIPARAPPSAKATMTASKRDAMAQKGRR